MIQENYVSFEVAKLLKEKGFDEICSHKWGVPDIDKGYILQKFSIHNGQIKNSELIDDAYTAPTHQMAMKWLREKYYIYADPIKQGNYNDCSEYYTWLVARMGIIHRNSSVADKLSYEDAVEAALKYALENLI